MQEEKGERESRMIRREQSKEQTNFFPSQRKRKYPDWQISQPDKDIIKIAFESLGRKQCS